ncbi:MAG: response regulator [Spirochaetes bacterium]|nr:response regulator [Spirochaetota bacterium]
MRHYRVLIVEDEVILRKYVISVLETLGCQIGGESSTGEEAVEMAIRENPDLIFMDIKLAGRMNGIEAAREIGSQSSSHIAFMSAYDYEDSVKYEKIPNCIAYLNKPVERNELQGVLKLLDSHIGHS